MELVLVPPFFTGLERSLMLIADDGGLLLVPFANLLLCVRRASFLVIFYSNTLMIYE